LIKFAPSEIVALPYTLLYEIQRQPFWLAPALV